MIDDYEKYRKIYNEYLIVKNIFSQSFDVIGDFDKTMEIIKLRFKDLDIEEKEDFYELIKSDFNNQDQKNNI